MAGESNVSEREQRQRGIDSEMTFSGIAAPIVVNVVATLFGSFEIAPQIVPFVVGGYVSGLDLVICAVALRSTCPVVSRNMGVMGLAAIYLAFNLQMVSFCSLGAAVLIYVLNLAPLAYTLRRLLTS